MNAGSIFSAQPAVNVPASKEAVAQTAGNMYEFGTVLQQISAGDFKTLDSGGQKLTKEQTAILEEILQFLGLQGLSDVEGGQAFGRDIILGNQQVETHPFVQQFLGETGTNGSPIESLSSFLKEAGALPEDDSIDGNDQSFLLGSVDLLAIVKAIGRLDEQQLKDADLKDMSNVLKLAKIIELVGAYKDRDSNGSMILKDFKDAFTKVSEKIQKLLEANTSAPGTGFSKTSQPNKMDISNGVFTRIAGELNQNTTNSEKKLQGTNTPPINGNGHVHFQMSKLEQLVLTLEKNGQPVNQEQFIQAFEKILSKAQFSNSNGIQKLFLKLAPEHLGSLRIEIIQKDSLLTAKIVAVSAQAKEMLESNLQGLKHAFSGQHIHIEKIEISQAMNSFSQERFLDKESGGNQQQNQRREQPDKQDNEDLEFNESFQEALLNTEV
ncbi:flagellar hook-length control protein FliK [Peribacillus sp. SCS-155]|uniref:flagellar hook-length control protein FliK n=1 Tax=Peribacillus sedimenti TaxID=3115297 RepID=UPI0039059EBC